MIQVIFWIAVGAGALAAIAALYGRYYVLPPFLTGPHICKEEAGGCQILFRSKNAALLGVPNAIFGFLFYVLLSVGILMSWPGWMLLAGASAALLMSLVLMYSLVANKRECRICWIGHFSNIAIWIILALKQFAGLS